MQICEEHQIVAKVAVFFFQRLFDFGDEGRLRPDFFRRAQQGRAGGFVVFVRNARIASRACFHHDRHIVGYELLHPVRCDRHTMLIAFDFPGNSHHGTRCVHHCLG